jgi:hypothetical protein
MPASPESPNLDKPKDQLSILDNITAGFMTESQAAKAIMNEVYAGLEVYCSIPDKYRHCELAEQTLDLQTLGDAELRQLLDNPPGAIINPTEAHLETIELFRMISEGDPLVTEGGDSLRPTVGAYLQGPPGVGKTHIMAAFGRVAEAALAKRLHDLMTRVRTHIGVFYRQFKHEMDTKGGNKTGEKVWSIDAKGGTEIVKSPEQKFNDGVEGVKRMFKGSKDQPTDMLYLGFEQLCQLHADNHAAALAAIEQAPVVFVDDVHGKGDRARLTVIQQLLERRYELGKFGTFLTTNVDAEHVGGDDENVAKRILSRTRESFVTIDFNGAIDWREQVKQRRINIIRDEIKRRIAERAAPLPDPEMEPPPGEERI